MCVDFRNLNKCLLKENYPVPKMDRILQRVFGAKRMSFLDGYLGFNQIVVAEEDREKTAFTTPWGTFMYAKMPWVDGRGSDLPTSYGRGLCRRKGQVHCNISG